MQRSEKPKIPDNAKLVFKGILYSVWHFEKEMYDGSKATLKV